MNNKIKIISLIITAIFSFQGIATFSANAVNLDNTDLDPLVDITVTVEIQKIRSLEKFDRQIPAIEKIDMYSDPDFYVKIFINDVEFKSEIWHNKKYIYDPGFKVNLNVPDDEEIVKIKIQLWDWNQNGDKLCDISPFSYNLPDTYDVDLEYSIRSGHWEGDDYCTDNPNDFDLSGYGRLNGCDDGSI